MKAQPEKPTFGPFINFFDLEEGILRGNAVTTTVPITSVHILKRIPYPASAEVLYLFQIRQSQELGQFINPLIDQD